MAMLDLTYVQKIIRKPQGLHESFQIHLFTIKCFVDLLELKILCLTFHLTSGLLIESI